MLGPFSVPHLDVYKFAFRLVFVGQNYGRRFYGGIGIEEKMGRALFAVTNVATEVNSVEQVCCGFF